MYINRYVTGYSPRTTKIIPTSPIYDNSRSPLEEIPMEIPIVLTSPPPKTQYPRTPTLSHFSQPILHPNIPNILSITTSKSLIPPQTPFTPGPPLRFLTFLSTYPALIPSRYHHTSIAHYLQSHSPLGLHWLHHCYQDNSTIPYTTYPHTPWLSTHV